MTVTPARTPASARPSARRRGWARAVAATAATLLLIGSGAVGASAADLAHDSPPWTAASPSPTPTPSASGRVDFTLSPAGSGIVRTGDALSVSVTIANGTPDAVAPAHVTLRLGATVLADRAALTAWLGAGTFSTPTTVPPTSVIGTVDMPVVAPASSESRSITIAAVDPSLTGRTPGVYPLIASYDGAGGTVASTSVMIVPDTAAPATPVGIVVPITGPATGGGLLTAAQLTDLTAPGGSLSSQLDAVDGTSAILAVDPAIPAAIRVLGAAAPAKASAWLARLESLPNSRFALQFGDADIAAQLEAGVTAPQRPTSLQAYMTASDFVSPPNTVATSAPPTTPTPAPTAGGATYPSLDQLLDIGGATAGVYWPAAGTTTTGVLSALAASGPGSMTLVPSASLKTDTGATATARTTVSGADVLAYDSDVSSALRAASVTDTAVLRGAPLAAASAYLAFAAAQAGGRPLLVTVERAVGRSSLALGAAISTLQNPGIAAVGLGAVTSATATSAQAIDGAPDPARAGAASTLFSGEARVAGFATILDDATALTGPQRAETLQLLGNAWRDTPEAWQTALAAQSAATSATLDAVGILPPTTIQLLSSQAPLQFWVRNDLAYPVNVVLSASPDDLRVDVQPHTVVTGATARSNTRVEVPVTAHIGNAQVSVDLQLHSPTGEVIGAPQRADITVRADWEGIGVTSLLVIIGLLIVFGLVRTVLRRRRARRQASTDAAADPAAPSDGSS